jgi:transcriptional regulator with XRE-family HTH domain
VPARQEAEIFGATVRRLRLERDRTQEQLAEAAGLTSTYIGMLERGTKVPSLTVVLRLARGLKVAPAVLLEGFTAGVLRGLRL